MSRKMLIGLSVKINTWFDLNSRDAVSEVLSVSAHVSWDKNLPRVALCSHPLHGFWVTWMDSGEHCYLRPQDQRKQRVGRTRLWPIISFFFTELQLSPFSLTLPPQVCFWFWPFLIWPTLVPGDFVIFPFVLCNLFPRLPVFTYESFLYLLAPLPTASAFLFLFS